MDKNNDREPDVPFFSIPAQPGFSEYFDAHKELVDDLSRFEPSHLIASIAGLLTMSEWQASTLRLEVLQHLAISVAHGTKKAKQADFKSWLTELGDGMAGRMEDPSEDVFASRVLFMGQNFLVFDGIYEASAFLLQRFLNVLERMPPHEPFLGIRRCALALLRLSNEVARRAGIAAFQTGQTLPLRNVPNRLLRRIPDAALHVKFSSQDLNNLSIPVNDLEPIMFDPLERDKLREESLGYSTLESRPVAWFREYVCLALPTAVSAAIRRMVIDFCISNDMQDSLYKAYMHEHSRAFSRIPLLGGHLEQIRFQRHDGIFVANTAGYIDKGRLLHLCFAVDSFDEYADTGLNDMPDHRRMSEAVRHSIAQMHQVFSVKDEFRNAISLVVLCPWGRPLSLDFERVNDPRWRLEHISAADLEAISWTPTFSPLSLWRLLDSRDRLHQMNVNMWNFNGLLNLFAWSQSLDGHLVPHAQMPDNQNEEMPLQIMISQNGLLDVRKSGAEAWNLHFAQRWDGENVKVRRENSNAYFVEDQHAPLYVSMDDLAEGKLVATFEAAETVWWLTVETPNLESRDFHYRLWHALTMWLKRAAPVLEKALPVLPTEPIVWSCHFDDSNAFDPTAPLPTREGARALLEITVDQNIIRVHAKKGFLSSFRHATNVGESLLIESLVKAAFAMVDVKPSAKTIEQAMAEIVPDEWARDIHFFMAREFRDFVRESLPRDPILISEQDAAFSCLGLGWRVRTRTEEPRIYGIDECCIFLGSVIDSVWEEIRAELKKYRREPLILQLMENHEATMKETDQWLRTAKAVLALHINKEQTAHDSAMHLAKLNASSLSTRLLIEIALCECPEGGGIEAGELDTARLLANVIRMHHLGGWSEAIKYGGKKAEVRITPLGDVHTHTEFDENIATPYGEALGVKRFRHGARGYEENYKEAKVDKSVKAAIESEFWDAWIDTFGFSIDELRTFMDNVDDEGVDRKIFAFTCNYEELCTMEVSMKLPAQTVRNILDALSLSPRESWTSTPPGFSPKDWYPWRFRRRLSLISRPIIRLSNSDNSRYLIAPGALRNGAAKILDYCLNGGYDAKDFPRGRMRSWIGAAENKRGHEFNMKVSDRLRELGWQTKPNIKLTEILNAKLDRNYGDIDVLAWNDKRILAIECKDLELAMTVGDMARQIHEFQGVDGLNGKPDRLKKHLARIAVLRDRMDAVRKYTGSAYSGEAESYLVFSEIVPMAFSELADQKGVRISMFEDLAAI